MVGNEKPQSLQFEDYKRMSAVAVLQHANLSTDALWESTMSGLLTNPIASSKIGARQQYEHLLDALHNLHVKVTSEGQLLSEDYI